MERQPAVLISLCLLGAACRYDGRSVGVDGLDALAARCALVPVCPEQLGGLPTPRAPAERVGGRVVTRTGVDVTDAFGRGANAAVKLAFRFNARYALLKASSPSCGAREIYDGSFAGRKVPGMGVAAEALRAVGVAVFDERQIDDLLKRLEAEHDDTL